MTRRPCSAILALGLAAACSADPPPPPGELPLTDDPAAAPAKDHANDRLQPSRDGPVAAADDWASRAKATHAYSSGALRTPHGSYRIVPDAEITDEWHDASQLGADAILLALGERSASGEMDATFAFVDRLWDRASPAGGYFPRAAVDGSGVETATKFVDDNALSGVMWLDAREAVDGAERQAAFLDAARSAANFLMHGDLWDATLGGGFWWNTDKPDKPTQSNGLALQLFLRLHALTHEAFYADWATSVLGWLEATLRDPSDGLFAWKIGPSGRESTKFTYDQAILIDAYVLRFAQTNDKAWLDKAVILAELLHKNLWAKEGGYVISTADRRLSPVYSAWASCSLVSLFRADHNPKWRKRAEDNLHALEERLLDRADHGYFSAARPDGSERTTDKQAVDQAWMQRAQGMLARASSL